MFCGTFDAKGAEIATGGGRLTIARHGEVTKLVRDVEQITFSGPRRAGARPGGDLRHRARRVPPDAEGLALTEVAPGVDVRRDVLERMDFAPLMPSAPKVMAATHFTA